MKQQSAATKNITLRQAITGYMLNMDGRHVSQHTLDDYKNTLNKFEKYMGGCQDYRYKGRSHISLSGKIRQPFQ